MTVIILNDTDKEVIDRFTGYVPKEYRKYCDDGTGILLGAVENGKNGLVEAGITVLAIEGNSLVIKWMWMDPDYRNHEGGAEMLGACFLLARENEADKLIAQVPALDDKYSFKSETALYFTNYGFDYVTTTKVDGIRVFLLNAPSDGDRRHEGMLAYDEYNRALIDSEYDKFPTGFEEIGTEYYSGVFA